MISEFNFKPTTSIALLLLGLSLSSALAEDVIFVNNVGKPINLHLRTGAVGSDPETRGSANISIDVGAQNIENVGDGDAWFAYGLEGLGQDDNPALCYAMGGETVTLTGTSPTAANGEPCFVSDP